MSTEQKAYSIREVARMLNLNPETIRRRIKEERLKIIRSNGDTGAIRILETEYNRFVAEEMTAKR